MGLRSGIGIWVVALGLCLAASLQAGWPARDAVESVRAFNRPLAAHDVAGVKEKFAKMSLDAHAFFRGTTHLFYDDVTDAGAPWAADPFVKKAPECWLTGDAHLKNFATRRLTSGKLSFDFVDFDESLPGPFSWDLLRLATSVALVARAGGLDEGAQLEAVEGLIASYSDSMEQLARGAAPASLIVDEGHARGKVKKLLQKAAQNTNAGLLDEWVDKAGPRFKIGTELTRVDRAPFGDPLTQFAASRPDGTRFFGLLDAARRLDKGTGSLGRARFWLLVQGPTPAAADDVILELKESGPSVLAGRSGARKRYPDEVERVLAGYQHLCPEPPAILGRMDVGAGHFLVRTVPYEEEKLKLEKLNEPEDVADVTAAAGAILARCHAHSAPDAAGKIAGWFDANRKELAATLAGYAVRYAQAVEADHSAFAKAVAAAPDLGLGGR